MMRMERKPKKPKQVGQCALTKTPGVFVDSHIIPLALTRPAVKGLPFYQYGEGSRPSRRWSSWYDPELVTAKGEEYLEELDTWAIAELRKHKLVWSGWGDATDLGELHSKFSDFNGMREVKGLDPKKIRLFFMSLLWRAAASTRPEFSKITLPPEDLETLRLAIIGDQDLPGDFYPVQLTQISTKGVIHNQTPFLDSKFVPDFEDPMNSGSYMPVIRFYFDGLVAHVHLPHPRLDSAAEIGNLWLGYGPSLVLSTVAYQASLQKMELEATLSPYVSPDGTEP